MFDEAFKNWFIGFSEGECSFTHTSAWFPRFSITQKNKPILDFIKNTFGFGFVYPHSSKDPSMWRYVVEGWKGLNVLRELFAGNLRTDFKQKQFASWVKLWNYNDPHRLAGRLKERIRIKNGYLRDPKLAERHRVLVRKWNRNNRAEFNANKRKSWFNHRERNLVKHRERNIISREMERFVRESVELCLISG
jgi:hypothetical protein